MATRLSKLSLILAIALSFCQSCSTKSEEDQLVTISTRLGDIKLLLYNDTPIHKKSFLELAEAGAYDSTTFYRVVQGFMIQGGNFSNKPAFEQESRRLIPAEILPNHFHQRGVLAAARQPIKNNPLRKSSTQFYIVQGKIFDRKALTTKIEQLNNALPKYLYDGNHEELIGKFTALQDSGKFDELQALVIDLREDIEKSLGKDFTNNEITAEQIDIYTTVGGAPHLDGDYTVFGQVLEGLETVDKIAALEVDSVDNPLEPVYMQLKVEDVPKDSITAWYGYEYPQPTTEETK